MKLILKMSWDDLIQKCIDVIESYNPVVDSPDTHFQRLYGSHSDKNEAIFIQQVFYNVNRYKDFLRRLNKAIFTVQSTITNSKDSLPFMIFSYLALFRLEELGFKHFKRLVETQEPLKMHVLLSFIFNGNMLREHVREMWMEVYDYTFIDNEIIAKAEAHYPEVQNLLNSLSIRATGQAIIVEEEEKNAVAKRESTKIVPFNITEPKPKVRYIEEEIFPQVKAHPMNQKIFSYSLRNIEDKKKKRRVDEKERTKNKYDFDNDPIKRLFV